MSEILGRLKYCQASLLTAANQVVALNRPAKADYRSVYNFMLEGERPLCEEEEEWIKRREDLITLRPGREHAWLDSSIEHLLRWLRCPLIEFIFCSAVRIKISLDQPSF
jgi:hypothetical protein